MNNSDILREAIKHKKNDCTLMPFTRLGYGGKVWTIQRLALFLTTGRDRSECYAVHRCGNKNCANPDHLFWRETAPHAKRGAAA